MDAIMIVLGVTIASGMLVQGVLVLRYAASTEYKARQALRQRLGTEGKMTTRVNVPYTEARRIASEIEVAAANGRIPNTCGEG